MGLCSAVSEGVKTAGAAQRSRGGWLCVVVGMRSSSDCMCCEEYCITRVDVEKLACSGEKAMLHVHLRKVFPKPIFNGSVHTGKWADCSELKVYWRKGRYAGSK